MSSSVATAPARARPGARPAAPRRAPTTRPVPRLRVVPPPRARRFPRPMVLAALGTIVFGLALVVAHVMLAQSQLSLDRLNSQVNAAQQRYEQARLQHAQNASPATIIARAAKQGLAPAAQPPVAVPVPTAATTVP